MPATRWDHKRCAGHLASPVSRKKVCLAHTREPAMRRFLGELERCTTRYRKAHPPQEPDGLVQVGGRRMRPATAARLATAVMHVGAASRAYGSVPKPTPLHRHNGRCWELYPKVSPTPGLFAHYSRIDYSRDEAEVSCRVTSARYSAVPTTRRGHEAIAQRKRAKAYARLLARLPERAPATEPDPWSATGEWRPAA